MQMEINNMYKNTKFGNKGTLEAFLIFKGAPVYDKESMKALREKPELVESRFLLQLTAMLPNRSYEDLLYMVRWHMYTAALFNTVH